MIYNKLLICLLLITTTAIIGQEEDSINYQDFPRQQLTTLELQQIARIFPQVESYYHQNKIKDEINAKQKEVIDTLLVALAKTDLKEIKYLEQIKLKDKEIEAVKPKFWQQPIFIVGEVILALITGFMIAK